MSKKIELSAHLNFEPMTACVTLRVEPASDVIVEDSPTSKFLRPNPPKGCSRVGQTRNERQ